MAKFKKEDRVRYTGEDHTAESPSGLVSLLTHGAKGTIDTVYNVYEDDMDDFYTVSFEDNCDTPPVYVAERYLELIP